jgi:ubiquinone/menaquinone biosynthesis C-methylase UbiE
MTEWWKGFQDVDSSTESKKFLNFMKAANKNQDIQRYRELMVELCPIRDDTRILDVGCGMGQEARRLARLVGASGCVVGFDRSEAMIAEARAADGADIEGLEFQVGDAHAMEFEDGTFDLVRSERILVYVDDPLRVIAEMSRVVKPGGRVISYEFDHLGAFIDSDMEELTRRIEKAIQSGPPNPKIARQLPYYYRRAGLGVEHIVPFTCRMPLEVVSGAYGPPLEKAVEAGEISREELDAWWQDQELMDRKGQSFFGAAGFIVAGSKT